MATCGPCSTAYTDTTQVQQIYASSYADTCEGFLVAWNSSVGGYEPSSDSVLYFPNVLGESYAGTSCVPDSTNLNNFFQAAGFYSSIESLPSTSAASSITDYYTCITDTGGPCVNGLEAEQYLARDIYYCDGNNLLQNFPYYCGCYYQSSTVDSGFTSSTSGSQTLSREALESRSEPSLLKKSVLNIPIPLSREYKATKYITLSGPISGEIDTPLDKLLYIIGADVASGTTFNVRKGIFIEGTEFLGGATFILSEGAVMIIQSTSLKVLNSSSDDVVFTIINADKTKIVFNGNLEFTNKVNFNISVVDNVSNLDLSGFGAIYGLKQIKTFLSPPDISQMTILYPVANRIYSL